MFGSLFQFVSAGGKGGCGLKEHGPLHLPPPILTKIWSFSDDCEVDEEMDDERERKILCSDMVEYWLREGGAGE